MYSKQSGFSLVSVLVGGTLLLILALGLARFQSSAFQSQRKLAQLGEFTLVNQLVTTILMNPESCRRSFQPVAVDGTAHDIQLKLANGNSILSPDSENSGVKVVSAQATIPAPTGGNLVGISQAQLDLTLERTGAPADTPQKSQTYYVNLVIGMGSVWSCLYPGQAAGGHILFVRKQFVGGNLGGLAGADTLCRNSANAAGLGTNWTAVLGDQTTSLRSRVHIQGPVYNTRGELLAVNEADFFDGSIRTRVRYYEDKTSWAGLPVFTGSGPDGSIQCSDGGLGTQTCCNDWTTSSPSVMSGNIGRNDLTVNFLSAYTGAFSNGCEPPMSLFCLSGWNS